MDISSPIKLVTYSNDIWNVMYERLSFIIPILKLQIWIRVSTADLDQIKIVF